MWQNYTIVAKLNTQTEEYQRALFLHAIGPEALTLYNGMCFLDPDTLNDVIAGFDAHFVGTTNETHERYVFNNRNQGATEYVEDYVAALRTISKACNFCDCTRDSLLRDRIVLGITDNATRKRLLQEAALTLTSCIDLCRTPRRRAESNNRDKTLGQQGCARKCKFCNKSHIMKKELCPAGGKTCNACKGRNHFRGSTQCSKTVHGVQNDCDSDSSSTNYGDISSVTADVHTLSSDDHGLIFCHMLIRKQSVEMQIDCRSTVNILPKNCVEDKDIRPESVTLKMWNNMKTEALSKCRAKTVIPATGDMFNVDYVIVDGDELTPVLSRKAAERMMLITVNYENFEMVSAVSESRTTHTLSVKDYPDVFDGKLGSLPGGKIHLTLEPNAEPVVRPPRTLPESHNCSVKDELDRLEHTGVIVKVDQPTD